MRPTILLPLLALATGASAAQAGAPPFKIVPVEQSRTTTQTVRSISAAGAQNMVDAVTAYAERQHEGVTIVIVDAGASLVLVKRMDGANLGSLQAATAKAISAAKMQIPTGSLLESGEPNLPLATAFISAGFTLLGGGEPIRIDDKVVGAIGVSGSLHEQDFVNVALAAVK